MNWNLLKRDDPYGQLARLYRQTEEAVSEPEGGSPAYEEFLAHQELIRRLESAARGPATPSAGRAALLAAVARQNQATEEVRTPMIGRILTARGLAALAVVGIFAGGAVTVGASGGVGGAAGNAGDVLSALHITHQTEDNPTVEANATDESTTTPEAEHTPRAVVGIPTDNPQHQPAASGTCEKGDTVVKTVPSGVAVNVPCQAAEDHGKGANDNNGDADETEAPEANETPEAADTPEPEATEHGEHGDNRSDRTPAPHSTEPAERATERADDSNDR